MAEIKEVKGATLPDGTEVRFKDEQARETIKDLQLSAGSLTLGETSGTAYRGDRGKIAYDHSQAAHAPTDALSEDAIRALVNEMLLSDAKAKNPVGTILFSTQNVNPSTYMGFGTWIPWGSGRVPVGVDDTDENFALVEQTGGESTHKLTVSEIPSHNHGVWGRSVYSGTGSYIALCNKANSSSSYVTGDKGGGDPHNNLQPYITCYMWKRTA